MLRLGGDEVLLAPLVEARHSFDGHVVGLSRARGEDDLGASARKVCSGQATNGVEGNVRLRRFELCRTLKAYLVLHIVKYGKNAFYLHTINSKVGRRKNMCGVFVRISQRSQSSQLLLKRFDNFFPHRTMWMLGRFGIDTCTFYSKTGKTSLTPPAVASYQ